MIQNIGSLPPGNRAGGKASGLDLLIKNGIPVPTAQVLGHDDITDLDLKPGRYAVRSSAEAEDGRETSFAGQFESRVRVEAKNVPRAIEELVKHATTVIGADRFSIIVQDWVESKVSGVAFSQHPTKDMPEVMVIDAVTGSNEKLMSGEINAVRAYAWEDIQLVPDLYPLPENVLTELKKYLLQIATLIESPADIEWAWDGQKLWILQARPITRLPAADLLDHEEARVMRLFAQRAGLVLDRNDFAESAPRPDEKTFQMIRGLYREHGAFHRAAIELGLAYNAEYAAEYFHLVFGWLYSDASRQPVQTPRGLFSGIKSVLRLSSELERFAREYYSALSDSDPEKTYAKASILAQFAQKQSSRLIPSDIWSLRSASTLKRATWKEPKTMGELYAVLREDTKFASYTQSTGEVIELPIVITKTDALDLRASVTVSGALRGQGVSDGLVEGICIPLKSSQRLIEARILIVSALTPAWFPFLDKNVLGIISETGSSMSHGAIQCRERGIPAIFGVQGATKSLSDRMRIQIDGKRGTIKILSSAE
jgi:phosphohistidine swiveling domain-containing protein